MTKLFALPAILFVTSCAAPGPTDPTDETIDNLVAAGFPADDIQIVDGTVYVGGDAAVSLEASREMLEADSDGPAKEQYRTKNLVSRSLDEICIYDGHFHGQSAKFSTGLNMAIANYNALHLTFKMVRISKTNTDNTNCKALINVTFESGTAGGHSGFPSGGHPFATVVLRTSTATYSQDVVEHVITHELGHTVGLRHSDYYNRTISCGTGGSEGAGTDGAILIPGTPTHATVGGSLMNSCFRSTETGEFTASDRTALTTLY